MKLLDISTQKHPSTFVMLDDADFEWASQWKWYPNQGRHTIYAMRTVFEGGVKRNVQMHREILSATTGTLVDHKDGNGLNNTRVNLRLATCAQNVANCLHRRRSASGYLGVTWHRKVKKFRARLGIRDAGGTRKMVYGGWFDDPKEAAIKRDEMALQHFGEFAALNFPK